MVKNVTLYRPVGAEELVLIIDGGMKTFPPRLFWQPIFYPVLNLRYASEIAERWNRGDVDSDGAGFVTEFDIPEEYFRRFQVKNVGLDYHQELWVPTEQLNEFNSMIVDGIKIAQSFLGTKFKMTDKLRGFV